eukprot:TRINITY_DN2191_c0_g1_i2.p1 TRINITY_DN2191_c0_g1~~TRINITY_DN2191_c0_g1_i2.p1  ORF type:complete len:117 (+),score=7.51 TRINITY_DN2191_c0_g1_i2:143-493(+)
MALDKACRIKCHINSKNSISKQTVNYILQLKPFLTPPIYPVLCSTLNGLNNLSMAKQPICGGSVNSGMSSLGVFAGLSRGVGGGTELLIVFSKRALKSPLRTFAIYYYLRIHCCLI